MLSLILPTYNEAENVRKLLPLLEDTLVHIPHEIIIVDDDSPDGTWEVAQMLAEHYPVVRVLRRHGRRGLSSAVVEGFAMAKGEVFAVMDCDGQHDPQLLPDLYRSIKAGGHVAVASRYMAGGSTKDWHGMRSFGSRIATLVTRTVPRVWASDPLSGYFAVRRTAYASIADRLHPTGFKILLEILAHLPRGSRVCEVPLLFGKRWTGQSKLSVIVQYQFISQLLRLAAMRLRDFLWEAQWAVPFIVFAVVFVLLVPSAWRLRLLTIDPALRTETQKALTRIADRQGWLLSDIEPIEAMPHALRFLHHEHRRGEDPARCYILRLKPLTLISCAE